MVEAAVCTFFGKSIGSMALGKITDYLIAPIGRQFNYCFCFKGNIENLETQLEKLEITRQCVQLGVDEDNRCVRIIGPDIEDWLTRASKVTTVAKRIMEDKENVQQGCLKGWCQNFKLRYLLSRKATKKTQVVVEVQADGIKFTKSSYLPLPPSMQPLPPIEFMEFGSRITSTEKIIEALKDDGIDLIAITGMGGVGKTTMAKEVAKRVKEENLFDEVATAVVSQDQDLLKVQSSIAKKLGLELGTDDLEVGASQLRQRLQQNKKILLILDDIWDEFNLDELGIPLSKNEKKSCKVLFTSRNQDLRLGVKSKLDFPLGILEEKEAWDLFREKVGDFADAPNVQKLAKDIVRECGGLPLALVIIGSTLQNRSLHVWKDALLRLQNPSSESLLEGVPASVYRSLQFSYNHLPEEGSKALFLLCSLFEEDYTISLEDLFRCGFGLKLFRGINDLNAARDRLYVLVDQLHTHNLLLRDGERDVKMHDIVRDVAISIAARGEHGLIRNGWVPLEWAQKDAESQGFITISVKAEETLNLPNALTYPKLKLLRLKYQTEAKIGVPDDLFEGTTELKVLDLHGMEIPSLPSSLGLVTNLQTLRLEFCQLNNISVIGDLHNLGILSFQRATIGELPGEIGSLVKLKLLDLRFCRLKRIAPGVISGLIQLQELYMRYSTFRAWEGEGNEEGENASLKEFNSLTRLNLLEILIDDTVILPRIPHFSNLNKFTIFLGTRRSWPDENNFEKNLEVEGTCMSPSKSGISLLLKITENLQVRGDGSEYVLRELVDEGTGCLMNLEIVGSNTMECIADTVNSWVQRNTTARVIFPILEGLALSDLPNLRQVIRGPGPLMMGSFGRLKYFSIGNCHGLVSLFHASVARALVQLVNLSVSSCNSLEEVICKEEEEEGGQLHIATNNIYFPKLESLWLHRLPRLNSFCKGLDIPNTAFLPLFPLQVAFPSLEKVFIDNVANLEVCGQATLSSWSLSTFTQLSTLYVQDSYNLRYLFSFSIVRSIPQLQELIIGRCSMTSIVSIEENQDDNNLEEKVNFPKLKRLKIFDMPNLVCFSARVITSNFQKTELAESHELRVHKPVQQPFFTPKVEFPILEDLELCGLPDMNHIWSRLPQVVSGSSFKLLHELKVEDCASLPNVFTPSVARYFEHLSHISMERCSTMEEVVAKDEDDCEENEEDSDQGISIKKPPLFPRLISLNLTSLPALRSFCHISHELEFPSLRHLTVLNCPQMKTSLVTPNLNDRQYVRKLPLFKINGVLMRDPNGIVLGIDEMGKREENGR